MTLFDTPRSARLWVTTLLLTAMAVGCGGGSGRDPILGTDGGALGAAGPAGPAAPGVPAAGIGLIFVPPAAAIVPGAACPVASATVPAVIATTPTDGNQLATTSTNGVAGGGKTISANFNIAMDAASINATSFTLAPTGGAALVPASVNYNAPSMVATLNTSSALLANTAYTAVIQNTVRSAAGNSIGCSYVWTFRTAPIAAASPAALNLGLVARFGSFGGTAGMTNTGNQTVVTGSNGNTADIGTIATGTSMVTGFHDSAPSDIYTEVPGVNVGNVTGKIYTCTNSTTGPTSAGANITSCGIATQARLDAQAAYLALAALPPGANPGANLAGLTLAPGVYTAPAGSFMIQGGNLTLDAQGDANAAWVFQMATSLTVGGPGAAFPQSVILAGGAQAKNVSWQVGSAATINAAGGGTMTGNILSQSGAAFSTAGNVVPVTLNGRALSLGASVTLVNTLVNVPAP